MTQNQVCYSAVEVMADRAVEADQDSGQLLRPALAIHASVEAGLESSMKALDEAIALGVVGSCQVELNTLSNGHGMD